MLNFASLLSLFSKVNTTLTSAQQLSTLALGVGSQVAAATGHAETAAHLQKISETVQKDAELAKAVAHLLTVVPQNLSTPTPAQAISDGSGS